MGIGSLPVPFLFKLTYPQKTKTAINFQPRLLPKPGHQCSIATREWVVPVSFHTRPLLAGMSRRR